MVARASATFCMMNWCGEAFTRKRFRSRVSAATCSRLRQEMPRPAVVFSTHMDTVPPYIPSSEDAASVYGRGSCDAKGIIAVQIAAAERLRQQGIHVGVLFLVGEERDSLGAKAANQRPIGSKFLINGEPSRKTVSLSASKGAPAGGGNGSRTHGPLGISRVG